MLSLDDYNDEEIVRQTNARRVRVESNTKEIVDLKTKYIVDLGLPSGTLWCRNNLGCDFEILNNNPYQTKPENWYGNYYAWGEIEPKKEYSWETYQHANNYNKLTKYCNNAKYGANGYTDDLTELQCNDDAAYKNFHVYNNEFAIPTIEQFKELLQNTQTEWVVDYEGIKGLNGRLLTSKKNGKQIFLPAAGYYAGKILHRFGKEGDYWSKTISKQNSCYAGYLFLNEEERTTDYNCRCEFGFTIRPVLFK